MSTATTPNLRDDNAFAVLTLRNLIFDICNQNGGGHGGSAVGMAAIGVALWKYTMRYNPSNPDWFDRDRFVLSNGHCAIFLYALNHLTGYDAWTMDELKGYADPKLDGYETIAHGHPEIECPGVEVTTGPLGQGIANAVGLAIASKNLGATFNEPGFEVVKSRIWCMTGDGCLMEGVALEAISLAGHLKLDNLVLIYDNNGVTCDGPLDWINAEDTNSKMRASGWHVLDVLDGSHDVQAIREALQHAKNLTGKPVFINIRTVIGVGTTTAGTAKAHHGAFDADSVAASKILAGQNPSSTHSPSERGYAYFREWKRAGEAIEREWNDLVSRYAEKHPEKAAQFAARQSGDLNNDTIKNILSTLNGADFHGTATRESNGLILQKLWSECPALCGGGADLVNSNKFLYSDTDVFLPGTETGYKGRYIRYGIREHAMAAISNGLAAYNPGTFFPVTATFLIFYLYAVPGVRMGALSHLPTIHIATHDSFAEGQNGPTHQPVEVDSLFRAMPNLTYIRPCDAEEVIGAWLYALTSPTARTSPTMISVARDPVSYFQGTDRHKVHLGAYVLKEVLDADLTLVSCGSNLCHVVDASAVLEKEGLRIRIVSCPSFDLFDRQDREYRESVFRLDGKPIVSVEEYVATGWARYVTASIGMSGFGFSASNKSNYARFGLDAEGIVRRVKGYLEFLGGRDARGVGWQGI
ncbi:Transketolase, thiamine diphosphate binding domain-containing protein [Aspergillus karnatakaensis]|uniref:Transketolase, thiamine diphosphate binding domain-containing protein n=1 Tax=Aspergillus karnatakaensis TaxID=1810916 RepID=UPI003CCD3AAF